MKTLTGAPADAYLSAWMSGSALNARKLRADALAARTSGRALNRLRLAALTRRCTPVLRSVSRRTLPSSRRRTAPRRTSRTACKRSPDRPPPRIEAV